MLWFQGSAYPPVITVVPKELQMNPSVVLMWPSPAHFDFGEVRSWDSCTGFGGRKTDRT
jgi:hypothetical protein